MGKFGYLYWTIDFKLAGSILSFFFLAFSIIFLLFFSTHPRAQPEKSTNGPTEKQGGGC